MSTMIPARNRQLAMQAKLSASDESMRELLDDWLMGHQAFDAYDADQRAQLVVDLQTLNGLSGMGASDWHITAAALAEALEQSDAAGIFAWIEEGVMYEAHGDHMSSVHRATLYWRNVAAVPFRYYAACSVEELLDGSDRDIYP